MQVELGAYLWAGVQVLFFFFNFIWGGMGEFLIIYKWQTLLFFFALSHAKNECNNSADLFAVQSQSFPGKQDHYNPWIAPTSCKDSSLHS